MQRDSSSPRTTRRGWVVGVAVLALTVMSAGVVLANHSFSDVGNGHQFHDEISWLAESGISEGYPDGTFRPGQPVTRQAMAAFMMRMAGNMPHTVSDEFESVGGVTTATSVGSIEVEAPVAGTITVHGQANFVVFGAGTVASLAVADAPGEIAATSQATVGLLDGNDTIRRRYSLSPTGVFEVEAGTHTIHLNAMRSSGFDQGTVNVANPSMTATFVPHAPD